MDNKCKCGHEQKEHTLRYGGCFTCFDTGGCQKFQPCVEPEPQKVIDQLKNNPEIMAQIKQGMKERREGNVLPWNQVRKELGIEPAPPVKDRIVLVRYQEGCNLNKSLNDEIGNCEIQANAQLPVIIARAKREQAREILNEILAIKKSATCDQTDKQGFWDNFWYEFEALKSKYIPEEK
jgi:hypothetical protein